MIRRLLLPLVLFALAFSGSVVSAGVASAAVVLNPETITAGHAHTCALDTAGKAWCWGNDVLGQLGNGSAGQADKYSPVKVAGDRVYLTITSGEDHSCALDTAGKAWCWGRNNLGQVGDGSAVDRFSPVKVAGDRVYQAITVAGAHSCALDTAGKAWCWGMDLVGQVGDGAVQADTHAPVKVAGDRVFKAITAGHFHTCALDAAGKGWCWGTDEHGEAGGGSTSQADKYSPVPVAGGRVFKAITAGNQHTCALDSAGKAWCWGADDFGQLGDGSASQENKYSPVRVAGDRVFTTITAGSSHTCTLDAAGKGWCWGSDEFGQAGGGATSQADKYTPVPVAGGRVYLAITAGSGGLHTCALDSARKAWCWGYDAFGQVGDGSASQADKYSPVPVAGGLIWRQP